MANRAMPAKRLRRVQVEVRTEWLFDAAILAALLIAFTIFTWT